MTQRNIVLTYGIAISVGISFWIFIEYALGLHTTSTDIGRYTGYASIIIPLLALWYALKNKRDQSPDGTLSITKGVVTGFLVSVVAGIILAAFMFSYAAVINPTFGTQIAVEKIEALRADGVSEEQVLEAATATLALYSPAAQAFSAFFGAIIQGTAISLIFALILRRKPSVQADQEPSTV